MQQPSQSQSTSFWRCERCDTPNPWKSYLTNCVGCGAPRPPRPAGFRSAHEATTRHDADAEIKHSTTLGERWLIGVSLAYAVLILVVLGLIQWWSDRWWPATLLLFMPRGLFLFPILILAAWAGWLGRRKFWAVHGAIALVVLIPLMGFSLPFGRLAAFRQPGSRLKVMTFNSGNQGINASRLRRLAETEKVDIICFQEGYTGKPGEGRPDPELEAYLSKFFHRNKERTIASRLPIVEELPPLEDEDGEQSFWRARVERVRVRAPSGDEFIVASVHIPSMYYALGGVLAGDMRSLEHHTEWRAKRMRMVATFLSEANDLPLLVGGDFNMPADSTMMLALRVPALRYGFNAAGWGFGYTRPSSFPWMRIDHILATSEFTFTRCWVGPDLGSDHLPLLAEVIIPKTTADSHSDTTPTAAVKTKENPRPVAPAVQPE
jgi:vancomycin resistance protein VanJ